MEIQQKKKKRIEIGKVRKADATAHKVGITSISGAHFEENKSRAFTI